MTNVLAKVVRDLEAPRGPDVELAVAVPATWLAEGATVQVELPRNLRCAHCGGGGCDTCLRAGAVSLRGRDDPPEFLEVLLPVRSDAGSDGPGLILRIPGRGGFAEPPSELPRGHLLLSLTVATAPDPCITRVRRSSFFVPAQWLTRLAGISNSRVFVLALVVVLLALSVWWISRAG